MNKPITGTGGRDHAIEQAARLRHMAAELRADLQHWEGHLPSAVVAEVEERIRRHEDEASVLDRSVLLFEVRSVQLTPGEKESCVWRGA